MLFDGRFETAGLNSWPGVLILKAGNTNMLTYQTAIRRRSTGYAPKLEVGGDNGLGERIEYGPLSLWENAMEGREVWIASSDRIPSGQVLPGDSVFLWQRNSQFNPQVCAASGLGGGDSISARSPGGGREVNYFTFNTSGGVGRCSQKLWTIPNLAVVRDRWIDWLVHYRFASTTDKGPITELFYRVATNEASPPTMGPWVNPISDTTQPNLVRISSSQGNFRWEGGVYKAESYTPCTTVYFGGMVIGPTRADAEAAMFD